MRNRVQQIQKGLIHQEEIGNIRSQVIPTQERETDHLGERDQGVETKIEGIEVGEVGIGKEVRVEMERNIIRRIRRRKIKRRRVKDPEKEMMKH